MRTNEENQFNAIWFGVCLGTALALVVLRSCIGL